MASTFSLNSGLKVLVSSEWLSCVPSPSGDDKAESGMYAVSVSINSLVLLFSVLLLTSKFFGSEPFVSEEIEAESEFGDLSVDFRLRFFKAEGFFGFDFFNSERFRFGKRMAAMPFKLPLSR